jgi:hypothetical protein
VLEDLSNELQAGVDRRIAVRAPVVPLALHRADEIFEVRVVIWLSRMLPSTGRM